LLLSAARTGLELHLRRLLEHLALVAGFEEGLLVEAERAGEKSCRNLLDAGVVFLDRVVEEGWP
jgi:hypothetical protein